MGVTARHSGKVGRYLGLYGVMPPPADSIPPIKQSSNESAAKGKMMIAGAKQDRGKIRVDLNECKGCGLCIEACPPKVIAMSDRLNHYGYRTAMYAGSGCTGCGICFLACPEPGAITVFRLPNAAPDRAGFTGIDIAEATPCPGN
jgi:2-oxoglutarate ferredoxin oxidoreductase subunit delta